MNVMEKVYTGLCVVFSVLIVIGNLTYQKFISLKFLPFHTFELSAGAILYPLTYLLTDLITEFYGKEKAQFCVRFAIFINIFAACIITCMDHLPATSWSKVSNSAFHDIFGMYSLAFVGSIVACYTSQAVDIILYLAIKKMTRGKYLWLRNNGSTSVSLLIDTTIVISFLTFFGILPKDQWVSLIIHSYSFKLFFCVCSTPLFYAGVFLIGKMSPKQTFNRMR